MCAGIRDAANLAWKLALVLRAGAKDTLLDSYEQERKPHVNALVGFAKKAGEVIGELDPEKARARDALLRGQLERGEAETIRQAYVPNLTCGILDSASGATAGTLFVQPLLGAAGEGALLDDVVAPRFLLATGRPKPQSWLGQASLAGWRRLGGARVVIAADAGAASGDILHFVERGTLFADWMARLGAAAVVVRPDRYVYGTARDADELNRMVERLGRQIFGCAGTKPP
jgi:3-(3-hydroxy-phenyl)propionate hydroxylase